MREQAGEIFRKHAEYQATLARPGDDDLFAINCYVRTSDCIKEHGGPDWGDIGHVLRDWYGIPLTPALHARIRALTDERSTIREEKLKEKRNK